MRSVARWVLAWIALVVIFVLAASVAHSQTPVFRVVVTAPVVVGDSSNHADLVAGQLATFVAKAYSAKGNRLARACSWGTTDANVATVREGRVTARNAGVAVIRATCGGITAHAYACVLPTSQRVPLRIAVARVAHDTARKLNKITLRASLDTLGQRIDFTPGSYGECVHWKMNAGPEVAKVATSAKLGADGTFTAPSTMLHFYPTATVGLTPQPAVAKYVESDRLRITAIAISPWRKVPPK
jgi:hypothetical protein